VFLLCAACAALLAYLSLIPFAYRPLTFDEALSRFAQLPYLAIGAQSRADWAANLLMYMPLGWLLARLIQAAPHGRLELGVLLAATLIGGAWAVAVEFGQLYFPNRTASLNDVLAEVLGTVSGAALWLRIGRRWRVWWEAVVHGGERTARAALNGYVIAYLVLNLAPFDFVLSGTELIEHLRSPLVGTWMSNVSCGQVPSSARLLFEVALAAPLGLWWVLHRRHGGGVVATALAALTTAVALEGLQLLLVSGVSQGASVAARAAGFAFGAWAFRQRARLHAFGLRLRGRSVVLALLVPYLAAVTYVNGWWSGSWLEPADAALRLGDVRWLPFYFQYFTTEQNAIRSGIVHAMLYVPVGVGVWLWSRRKEAATPTVAAVLGAGLAAVAELGKLFVPPRHPDPTDVLIAAVAAAATAALLRAISRPAMAEGVSNGATVQAPVAGAAAPASQSRDTPAGSRVLGAMALVAAFGSLIDFPVARLPLGAGLALYALLLARGPLVYLWLVPLALPMLDLAPYSGRLFWDEFDLLLLVTFGVRLLGGSLPDGRAASFPRATMLLMLAAVLASASTALRPLPPLDPNAFASYLSPYNALRLAKGYLWGMALVWLVARDAAADATAGRRLCQGLGLALLAVGASVLWERSLFTGVTALDVDFRVAGPVSAMHTGGAYLDALLVLLLPFAAMLSLRASTAAGKMLWAAATVIGLYALVVTFSRSTLAGCGLGAIAFGVLWARHRRALAPSSTSAKWRGWPVAAGAAVVLVGAGIFAMASPTLRERFASVAEDGGVRGSHWRDSFEMMRFDLPRLFFGMGLGSFPREYYLQHGPGSAAAYRLVREQSRAGLRLDLYGGRGLFFVQRIPASHGAEFEIVVAARAVLGKAPLALALCEATVLYSARCVGSMVEPDPEGTERRLVLAIPPAEDWLQRQRPIVLSLHNGSAGTIIGIESVSVRGGTAMELLRNGDFAQAMDHWFFTSDDHLAWHAKSLPLQVIFEMGLVGAVAWLVLGLTVVRRMALADPRVGAVAALGAGLMALSAVAAFDSVIDAPRLIVLLLLLCLYPGLGGKPGEAGGRFAVGERTPFARYPRVRPSEDLTVR
jgi:VanZ family protein